MHAPKRITPTSLRDRAELTFGGHLILRNQYFRTLAEGTMSIDAFRESQAQFYFAVRFFPRPMAALTARLPNSSTRHGLIHNLAEEHGYHDEESGVNSGCIDSLLAHDVTFLSFLRSIGVSDDELSGAKEHPGVRAFNLALIGACMMERTELAFACLGIIERSFADISALIGKAVVERGWVSGERLVHYKLHAEIDRRHAAEFFNEIEDAWKAGGDTQCAIEDGLDLGLFLFNKLYDDLYSYTEESR